jgi:hypothetical protein
VTAPVETKVKASTVASVLTALVVALASRYLWHGDQVPAPVVDVVGPVVTAVVTFAAGWLAPHTRRVDVSDRVPSGNTSTGGLAGEDRN